MSNVIPFPNRQADQIVQDNLKVCLALAGGYSPGWVRMMIWCWRWPLPSGGRFMGIANESEGCHIHAGTLDDARREDKRTEPITMRLKTELEMARKVKLGLDASFN